MSVWKCFLGLTILFDYKRSIAQVSFLQMGRSLGFPSSRAFETGKKEKRNLLFFQNDVSSERPEDGSYLIKALRQEILKLQPADKNEFLVTYEVREIS